MRIMISCGEPSGDLYAGALVSEIRRREPSVDVFGLGGPQLAAAGGRLIASFEGLSVTGLTEALRVLPRSFGMLRALTASAKATRPDVFVAVDFPDFNFRLMASLRRLGIPVVYYISPQLWAWRPGRMKAMQRHVGKVLVIFPFEESLYHEHGVPVEFVGHPLIDLTHVETPRATLLREYRLDPDAPTVALLPGSRRNELQQIVPGMAASLPLIRAVVPSVQFIVAAAPGLPDGLFQGLDAPLVRGRTDDVLAASDVVVTASGTATVQAALHERPMVVVYRLSPLTYLLGKPLVRVNTYAMANLVAGERIVPELIQDAFTPHRVATEVAHLLTDGALHASTTQALRRVRERLGQPGASGRAAEAVIAVARRGAPS